MVVAQTLNLAEVFNMELGAIYPAVLSLVLIGIIIGVGLAILGKLGSTGGLGTTAGTSINDTATAIGDFTDWIGIIVIVIAAAVIIGLVLRSFSGGRAR